MRNRSCAICLSVASLVLIAGPAGADVRLPAIFGDNMVLQSSFVKAVPVWGWARPGERVTVTFEGQTRSATTNDKGRWSVHLDPPKVGGPFEMTIEGANRITLHNILVGEVWVGSGQSNMQWPVKQSGDAEEEIANAKYPKIRLFTCERRVSSGPMDDTKGSWVECSPETVPDFSAVAYYFGRELHKQLGVPVGLIHTSWGGTPAEAWTSRAALEAMPECQPYVERWAKSIGDYPAALAKYREQLDTWITDSAAAEDEGRPVPPPPGGVPGDPRANPHRPSGLYNAMIHPIIPFAIRGAIWYQGESNAGRAYVYRKLFPGMITDWRHAWGEGNFPFLFVQLANFQARQPEPGDSAWAELREAQLMTLALPNTAMAVIIDIGEANNIHPKNKQEVGRRLGLAAEAMYGKKVEYSGPMYESMKVDGNSIRLTFTHAEGLVAKDGGSLKGFAIAGEDRKFVWADAKIDGDAVVVSSASVAKPVAVRYAWADNPECNLYNAAGLPASPFRTDDWPGVTANEK